MVALVIKFRFLCFFCGEYYDIKKMAHYYRSRFEPVARTLPTTHFSHVYRVLIQCVLTWILKGGIELIFFNASNCLGPVQGKFSFNESLNKIFADFRCTGALRVIHVCRTFASR